ncbi:Deoxycytidylate deaminase [Desulforamulus putei DSM 12395]|uniref:Deoxycytidylate deaminase n=2 Tax=Desulforamulus putei TaxID=74701 RepID=A0A1M4Y1Y3_9FIRM|nr:Deoxycytidylate deaminase [Desulforamulus putei DSM 12395]
MTTIIGLTGSFGSGCTHIAKDYLEKRGFKYISLSSILKNKYFTNNRKEAENRQQLQDYGNKLRSENGPEFLAKIAVEEIQKGSKETKWVVDSIKNPGEVKFFRNLYPHFYLFGVFADYEVRWKRKKDKYQENEGIFKKDDKRDSSEEYEYGQRVRDCFSLSDVIISNNIDYSPGNDDQLAMEAKIDSYLKLIERPSSRPPTQEESLMAMAYANSQRSSCLKRKVGAIIVDENGFLFSSGYNEVPLGEKPCKNGYGRCYRSLIKDQFNKVIDDLEKDPEKNKALKTQFITKIKILDHCRALHAEENAILNVARFGSSIALKGATLYTTTYPCNLCANKIAQVGIKKLVYLEPYPMEEAKVTLNSSGIEQKPFEGVSFIGFFKFFGGEII